MIKLIDLLREIKVNNPNYILPSHFPIKIENIDKYKQVLRLLQQKGYSYQGGFPMDGSYIEYKKFPIWINCEYRWNKNDPKRIFAMKNGESYIKQQKELGNKPSKI